MTYHSGPIPPGDPGTGGLITALSYNKIVGYLNAITGDRYPGATTIPTADVGYGIFPDLTYVAADAPITAANWTAVFQEIHAIGAHQGTSVAPIPPSVTPGELITAYNDYLGLGTLSDVLGRIGANRLLPPPIGQYALIVNDVEVATPSWTTGVEYAFSVDFGTWDYARHFFNLGGCVTIAGSYDQPVSPTPEDRLWAGLLTGMGTVRIGWHSTIPASGPGSSIGFYDLSTTFTEVYRRTPVNAGVYYSGDYISVSAKFAAAPGTNGIIDFKIALMDNDGMSVTKTGTLSYTIGNLVSAGALPAPGPAMTATLGTFTAIAAVPFPGVMLTLLNTPESLAASGVGAVTVTTPSCSVSVTGGTPPYTYLWSILLGTATITSPTSSSTTLSKTLTDGEFATGQAQVLVTDSLSATAASVIPFTLVSNHLNDSSI